MQEYRKALLWLTHGNHNNTPHPIAEETKQHMKDPKIKISSLLKNIEMKIQ
jgi:hypothetical protein